MKVSYEHWVVIQYVRSLIRSLGPGSVLVEKLVNWIDSEGSEIGLSFSADAGTESVARRRRRGSHQIVKQGLKDVQELIEGYLGTNTPEAPSGQQQNIDEVAKELRLDPLEQQIFEIALRYVVCHQFERLCDEIMSTRVLGLDGLVAKLLDVEPETVRTRMNHAGRLYRLGLVMINPIFKGQFDTTLKVPKQVLHALTPPNRGMADFRRVIAGAPQEPELGWEDFAHLGKDREFLYALLTGAIQEKARGINILLYGPPGTGKTEFAKVLARRVGLPIYSVGETGDEGSTPRTSERIAAIQIAGALFGEAVPSMLLFDEMEDLLSRAAGRRDEFESPPSKVFLNRLIESNPVPVIWTTNDTDCFDPALLRRMTYALEMNVPPRKVRESVWLRLLTRQSVVLPAEDLKQLAREFHEPPALAANAIRAARLAGGSTEQVRQAVKSVAAVLHGGTPKDKKKEILPGNYDLALVNADTNLLGLSDRICSLEGSRRVSLCLSGPPGTGKSAFVRHLAGRMNIEIIQKRASDLMSMWVGGTEKNIAAAFSEAREEESFLVFDEADSFLQDRSLAERSWEVTQVNEMLTWMESHEWPFACTTNFSDRLDSASLRRFTFKVNLRFMSPDQCAAAFRLYFGMEASGGMQMLSNLTPGDFALVHRKASILGLLRDPLTLYEMLRDECAAKIRDRKVGFMQPGTIA